MNDKDTVYPSTAPSYNTRGVAYPNLHTSPPTPPPPASPVIFCALTIS
jgi:hypothetical protein